ncbi:GDYXXLXY domain-containing protein [Spirulina sp. CS-785/01]|uniref:GDYXXLXY domain-containing protein n=1 Tax=Spirulina sp. CS-785/01 TaxID=3021716 RepID=UPI00232F8156|nr:GDYXXLXY domain-containing protein [Spirulina sp. CS-785/01]MDB9313566.1 GDYXXLXY domain-containing protein [Spirulina sp. CS-785/01]
MTNQNRLPIWRFLLPISLQIALILAVPAQAVYTHLIGTTVILQTAPVDPYDFLRGYYQTLNYEIAQTNTLRNLPGWESLPKNEGNSESLKTGSRIYVILEQPESPSRGEIPAPWKPVQVQSSLPDNVAADRVVIEGVSRYGTVNYGLERYYLPEDQREQINRQIRSLQRPTQPQDAETQEEQTIPFVVEVKVSRNGNAVPVSLWIGDRQYQF